MVCDLRSHFAIERLRRFVMSVTSGNHLFGFVFHFAKHVCLFLCLQAKEHRSFKGELSIILLPSSETFNKHFMELFGTIVNSEIYIQAPRIAFCCIALVFFF